MNRQIEVAKDDLGELPIPTDWRSTIVAIVQSLISEGCGSTPVPSVSPLSPERRARIAESVDSYRACLVELPEQSWDTSVCQWSGEYWDALIDLFTEEEGRSDLVLSLRVREQADGYSFEVMSVHVP